MSIIYILMSKYFELIWSLTRYKAFPTNSTISLNTPYVVEIFYGEANYYNTGKCSLKLFKDGKHQDLQINGWTFSYMSQGEYHFRGSYDSVDAELDCCTPQQTYKKIKIGTCADWEMETFAELYLNNIFLLSNCQNEEEYQAIKNLERKFAVYGLHDLSCQIKGLAFVNDLIKRSQENENYNSNFTNYAQALLDNRLSEIKQYITNLKLK